MSDPELMIYRATNHAELAAAFSEIQPSQREDVRKQLAGILLKCSAEDGWEATFARFNGRTVAEVLSDFTPDELRDLQVGKSPWLGVRRAAISSTAIEVKRLACPKCGGKLSIRYDSASPQPDGGMAGFLKIDCSSCVAGTCADGLSKTPPWIEDLGIVFETLPQPHGA